MVLLHGGYVLLEHRRFTNAQLWLSKSMLTPQDFEAIRRLGSWISAFEALFFYWMLAAFLFVHIASRKNWKRLARFVFCNAALLAGIAFVDTIVHLVTSIPAGNLIEPLLWPAETLLLLLIYVFFLWLWRKNREWLELRATGGSR